MWRFLHHQEIALLCTFHRLGNHSFLSGFLFFKIFLALISSFYFFKLCFIFFSLSWLKTSSLSFKFMVSFVIHFVYMNVHVFLNIPCSVCTPLLVCMFSRLTIQYWTTNRCVHYFSSFSAFLSCLRFFVSG